MRDKRPVLVVEDSGDDYEFLMWAWRRTGITNPVSRCKDGEEALDRLYRRGAYEELNPHDMPALVLLDLNLPRLDGRQVLATMKADELRRSIPVVVFTSSANPRDVDFCYLNGANSYVVKPIGVDMLCQKLQKIVEYWLEVVYPPPPA
jgi:CheY-like chemotaxis protein